MDNLDKVSELIFNYRSENNISQQEFAEQLNADRATISAIENKKYNIKDLSKSKLLKRIELFFDKINNA